LKTMNLTVFRPGLEIKPRDKMMELFPNGGHSGTTREKQWPLSVSLLHLPGSERKADRRFHLLCRTSAR
jgi:hypothetical protein